MVTQTNPGSALAAHEIVRFSDDPDRRRWLVVETCWGLSGVRGSLGVMLGIYGCMLVFHPKFGVGNRDASLSAHALMRR
jgi:hypothetical protein